MLVVGDSYSVAWVTYQRSTAQPEHNWGFKKGAKNGTAKHNIFKYIYVNI